MKNFQAQKEVSLRVWLQYAYSIGVFFGVLGTVTFFMNPDTENRRTSLSQLPVPSYRSETASQVPVSNEGIQVENLLNLLQSVQENHTDTRVPTSKRPNAKARSSSR